MKVKINHIFFLLSYLTFGPSNVFAQDPKDSLAKRIDRLFEKWAFPKDPGCVITIVRNDTIIYAQGYGSANLEHVIANTTATLFNTGSISKQLTGYCILLLERQGKLRLDDDIRTYLSWMPDFGSKITIRNLLHHTSGIRDYVGLASITGLDIDGTLTQDLALKLIRKQSSLNFKPGENFAYSNSNYVLLAGIVKAVSGQSFRVFTDSAILKPLGMKDSFFPEDQKTLIKNRAASYAKVGTPYYTNYFQNIYTFGDGGLFSSANDISKWMINFFYPKAGKHEDIEKLTKKGKLNSGKELSYAAGISVDTYKGYKQYTHGGANAGYTCFMSVFPDLKLGIAILSNIVLIFPSAKVYELADIFIQGPSLEPKQNSTIDSSLTVLKNPERMKHYSGDYISDEGDQFSFEVRNHKFYWVRYGRADLLLPVGNDSFLVAQNPSVKFSFHTSSKKDTTIKFYTANEEHLALKYQPGKSQTSRELQMLAGKYYSKELDCVYSIIFDGKDLLLRQGKIDDSKITFLGDDDLLTEFWWMRHLKIIRNKTNEVIGFDVDIDGVRHLRFGKTGTTQ